MVEGSGIDKKEVSKDLRTTKTRFDRVMIIEGVNVSDATAAYSRIHNVPMALKNGFWYIPNKADIKEV